MDGTQPISFPNMNSQPGFSPEPGMPMGQTPSPMGQTSNDFSQMGAPMGDSNPMNFSPVQPGGVASQGAQVIEKPLKKDIGGLIKTIAIVILSLVSLTFIGLFIWMFIRYDEVQMDINGQIDVAVAEAKDEQAAKDEEEFLQREKYPFRTFKGPADYGELTFEYPKTWSAYIAADASNGGDFEAYLNPIEVNVVSKNTINALRVFILNKSFEAVAEDYQKAMERRDSNLTMQSVTTAKGITGNRYTGTIPGTELSGFIFIFKIRDKTAILQTDSVLFEGDYNTLLDSVQFNA